MVVKKLVKWLRERFFSLLLWACFGLAIWAAIIAINDRDPSGWWQVTIELVGFPVLLYGLFELRRRLAEEQWKPQLRVGVASGDLEFGEGENLSAEAVVRLRSDGRFNLLLVVRNEGMLAARSVKIVLNNESFDEIPLVLRFSAFSQDQATTYSLPRGLEDRQITIYSGYDAKFWGQVRDFPSSVPLPWQLRLRCRVWADGLGRAVDESLKVMVIESQELDDVAHQTTASQVAD